VSYIIHIHPAVPVLTIRIPTEVVKEHRRKRTREEAATDQAQQAGPSKKMTPCKNTGAVLFEPTTRLYKKRTRRTRNSSSNK
jgi:hypothetical protein